MNRHTNLFVIELFGLLPVCLALVFQVSPLIYNFLEFMFNLANFVPAFPFGGFVDWLVRPNAGLPDGSGSGGCCGITILSASNHLVANATCDPF